MGHKADTLVRSPPSLILGKGTVWNWLKVKGDKFLHALFAATSLHLNQCYLQTRGHRLLFSWGLSTLKGGTGVHCGLPACQGAVSAPRSSRDFTSPVAPYRCGCHLWAGGFVTTRTCVPLCGHFPGTLPTPGLQLGDLCPTPRLPSASHLPDGTQHCLEQTEGGILCLTQRRHKGRHGWVSGRRSSESARFLPSRLRVLHHISLPPPGRPNPPPPCQCPLPPVARKPAQAAPPTPAQEQPGRLLSALRPFCTHRPGEGTGTQPAGPSPRGGDGGSPPGVRKRPGRGLRRKCPPPRNGTG